MRSIRFFLPCFLTASAICAQAPASPAPAAAQQQTCSIDQSIPSDGDIAIARKDYDTALTFFQSQVDKNPSAEEAHLGLVRALIGKDRTADAQKAAQDMLTKSPHSVLGEVAAGEADFRTADFDSAMRHAQAAVRDDTCEAQAMMLMARVFQIGAHFASAADLLRTAHRLIPNDELGRRAWIDSLPRKERLEELEKYLAGATELSAEDRESYENSLVYAKSIHPGECRISSKNETVQIPFSPIYGSDDTIHAYALAVELNGKKRTLEIDTGTSGITLSAFAAKRLGLTSELALKTMGAGDEGATEGYLTHVASIQIGDVQIKDCTVTVLQQKSPLDPNVDGLIGMDVFDRWLATVDYPKQKLVLSPLPPVTVSTSSGTTEAEEEQRPVDAITPLGMENWLHVIRIGHDVLLPTFANGGPVHFTIMDTRTSQTVFALPFAKQMGKLRESSRGFEGLSPTVKKIYAMEKVKVQFGQITIPPDQYYAFDFTNLSHAEGTEVSGFIGLYTLLRMTISIDYRDNLALLHYDGK